jgi:hypothetical protein
MSTGEGYRRVIRPMLYVYLVGSFLVFVAGWQLYVMSNLTDKYFAWHVKNPLTAAFLGGFYFTALLMALPSARERFWGRARIGIPGVIAFLWLTLIATLMHLDQFHLDHGGSFARVAAWAWLVVYVAVPPADTLVFIRQLRQPGTDPPRARPLPRWYRWTLFTQGSLGVLVGVVLFLAPSTSKVLWSWTLTPLTARASAAWLVGVGITLITGWWENDWDAIRPGVIAYTGLGVLQFVALARFGDLVEWGDPAAWAFVIVVASVMLAGAYGVIKAGRGAGAERPAPAAIRA